LSTARRASVEPSARSLLHAGDLFIYQQRERAILKSLRLAGVTQQKLAEVRILEVGCGGGGILPLLTYYGATPGLLHGLDIDGTRVRSAQSRFPAMSFTRADATRLPVKHRSYDIVLQSTMFSSILNRAQRKAAAAELVRVLRPGGFILWFDLRYNNPRNRRVQAVTRREITLELFPGSSTHFVSAVLLPPLARRIAPVSWLFAEALTLLPLLRTHYCAVIRPSPDG